MSSFKKSFGTVAGGGMGCLMILALVGTLFAVGVVGAVFYWAYQSPVNKLQKDSHK